MLYIKRISIADGDGYPFKIPAVRAVIDAGGWELSSPVTMLCGENGSGKSTLLEAIAVAFGFNAEGGSRNFNFKTTDSTSNLSYSLSFVKGNRRPRDGYFLRAESFYNVASEIDALDAIPSASRKINESYGGKSLHTRSHGEGFLALLLNRFGGGGLYILDEPESALSPTRQMMLISRMKELCDNDSQFIIATHSPIVLAYPGAKIFELSERGMTETSYDETETVTVTRQFLQNPARMIKYLTEDSDD